MLSFSSFCYFNPSNPWTKSQSQRKILSEFDKNPSISLENKTKDVIREIQKDERAKAVQAALEQEHIKTINKFRLSIMQMIDFKYKSQTLRSNEPLRAKPFH